MTNDVLILMHILVNPNRQAYSYFFFFFNDTATTEIYTLSLHDALPISQRHLVRAANRHSMGRPSPIPGLRQRHDLLAASARLECRWCLGAAAPGHADSLA